MREMFRKIWSVIRRFFDKCLKPLRNKRGGLGVPKSEAQIIAETLLPDIIAFFETEEGKKIYEKWKKEQEEKKQSAA